MSKIQKILLTVTAFTTLAEALLGPIYALYVKKIGGDLLDASSTYALFMFIAGITIYLIARVEDRYKHQDKLVVGGYGFSMVGTLGYLFVDSMLSLFAVQVILGLAVALREPAYDALFSSNKKHLTLAWGEWEAVYYVFTAIGAVIGGIIGEYFGFTVLLMGMFIMSVGAFITSLFLLKRRKDDN